MRTGPRPKTMAGEGGDRGGVLRQFTDAITAVEEAAAGGSSQAVLDRLAGSWAARVTGAAKGIVARVDLSGPRPGDTLYCTEPPGVLDATQAPFQEALGGALGWAPANRESHPFLVAAPLRCEGQIFGVLAVSLPDGGAEAAAGLRALAAALGPLLRPLAAVPLALRPLFAESSPAGEALVQLLARLSENFSAEAASFFVARPGGGISVLANRGLSEDYLRGVVQMYPRGAGGIAARLQAPLLIEDVQRDERAALQREMLRREGVAALLFVPSRWAGEFVGGVVLYFQRPRAMTPAELQRAAVLGSWLGPILRNFAQQRLLEDLPAGLLVQGERGWAPLNEAGARSSVVPALQFAHLGARLGLQSEEAAPSRSQIAHLASHALRDPLTAIKGYLGLAVERLRRAGQQPVAQSIERLLGPVERISQVADGLLSFALVENGQRPLARARLDLAALLCELGEEGVTVSAPTPYLVRGDAERLSAALRCLLRSAVQAHAPDGVRATLRDGMLLLCPQGATPGAVGLLRGSLGLEGQLALHLLALHGIQSEPPGECEFVLRLPPSEEV